MSKRKKPLTFPCTDSGNAEQFAALQGGRVRFDHGQGRWLIWDDKRHCWIEDKTDQVRRMMKLTARARHRVAIRLPSDTDSTSEERKRQIRWATDSESRHHIDAALDLAKAEAPIADDGGGWDADPWLLGVANGVIDLRTGKLREERPEDRITKHSPVRYDPGAQCPRFEQFVKEIFGGDRNLIAYVQKAVGYSLTGSTRDQCLFGCYGVGSNGKSTFLEIILYIEGDYGVDLPFSALEAKRYGSAPGEGVNLPGARFAKAVEVREGRRLDEARIKSWTGGDTISLRPLYRNSFSFQPTHKLWLAFNHKPVIVDNSPAMWRRIRLIPFLQRFEGAQKDAGLPDRLKAEASGILNWAIEGCVAWQREGLEPPATVTQATRQYEQESDTLRPFVEERCVLDAHSSALSSELWSAYQAWAGTNGERLLSRNTLADGLKRLGFTSDESGHDKKRIWRGLKLSDAGARVGAGADSGNFSTSPSIEEVSGDGTRRHPLTPAAKKGDESKPPSSVNAAEVFMPSLVEFTQPD